MAVTTPTKLTAVVLGIAFASPSYAYLDPGTGSIILQSVLAGIAVAMGLLRFYWQQFKAFLANLVGSPSAQQGETASEEFEQDSDTQNEA